MTIVCWSVKGGSGTTVVAAALALVLAAERETGESPVVAVDLAGDLPTALGVAEPGGPGVRRWMLAEPPPGAASLQRLAIPAGPALAIIPAGEPELAQEPGATERSRWERLADALGEIDAPVVVDAGTGMPPGELLTAASVSLLVVRPCYLALRRAVSVAAGATVVAVVREAGRALGAQDIGRALGVSSVIELPCDPGIARAVDAGLLAGRLPTALARSLRAVA